MQISLITILLFISVLTLGIIHNVALELFLYWRYPFLDLPVHMLGGAIIVLFLFALPTMGINIPPRYLTLKSVLLTVLIIGLFWEVFEMVARIPVIGENFQFDTTLDLISDVIGGAIGFYVAKRLSTLSS